MGAAEVPQIPSAPEKRGLFQRLRSSAPPEEAGGNRSTGTPWVASPFLRWGALGVAFISFSALLGYSALPDASDMEAAPALSFFAVYLTDDPLPAGLDGLIVSIAHVGAGDPGHARTLDLRVRSFDISQHHGASDALPVATGYVLPSERERVFIEFDAAVGLRGTEEVPLEVSERFLHVEYEAAEGSERSAVLLDIDLQQSVQEVDLGDERVIRFVPTVGEVYEESLPESIASIPAGEPMPAMEPLFASAVPVPPVRQYRSSQSPVLAPVAPGNAIRTAAADPLGVDSGKQAQTSSTTTSYPPSSSSRSNTLSSSTSKPAPTTTPTTTSSSSTTPTQPVLNHPPAAPHSPTPTSGAQNVMSKRLEWQGGDDSDGDEVTFDVYVSSTNPPPLIQATCSTTERTCTPNTVSTSTTYYWRVRVADGAGGVTLGDVWSFRTAATMCDQVGLQTACPVT